jgi:hypothetical protein
MADLDLIPTDYRRMQSLRRALARAAVAYLILVAGFGVGRAALGLGVQRRSDQVDRVEAALAREQVQQARIAELKRALDEAGRHLRILDGLRGGTSATEVLQFVDRAVEPSVWFIGWEFRRAGEVVEKDRAQVHTGYFIVLPPEPNAADPARERGWLMQTHMKIHAQARDHSSLAGFVRRLVAQPEIAEARVIETRTARKGAVEVVDFELAVALRTRS